MCRDSSKIIPKATVHVGGSTCRDQSKSAWGYNYIFIFYFFFESWLFRSFRTHALAHIKINILRAQSLKMLVCRLRWLKKVKPTSLSETCWVSRNHSNHWDISIIQVEVSHICRTSVTEVHVRTIQKSGPTCRCNCSIYFKTLIIFDGSYGWIRWMSQNNNICVVIDRMVKYIFDAIKFKKLF